MVGVGANRVTMSVMSNCAIALVSMPRIWWLVPAMGCSDQLGTRRRCVLEQHVKDHQKREARTGDRIGRLACRKRDRRVTLMFLRLARLPSRRRIAPGLQCLARLKWRSAIWRQRLAGGGDENSLIYASLSQGQRPVMHAMRPQSARFALIRGGWEFWGNGMVQLGGFEPPTSGSTIRRSNQLSYNCTSSKRRGGNYGPAPGKARRF